MAETKYKPCDLVIVRANDAICVVEVQRDIAKLGDRVDFLVKYVGLISGFVEDVLHCGVLDDLYCFIATAVPVYRASGVYQRVWISETPQEIRYG